jgi:transposase-like protein
MNWSSSMRTEDFHRWLSQATSLTPSQLEQALSWFGKQQQATEVMMGITDRQPVCPHCQHDHVIHWGNAHELPRYRCSACHKTFNALTGTPLAHLRHRERWAQYAQALIDGLSVRKAAKHCGVDKDTAFRWRHRFLTFPARAEPKHLQGIVEADETYFLESHKGERHLSRPPRKRGGSAAKRGLSEEQIPVLIARDRNRTTFDAVLPKANSQSVVERLGPVIDPDAILCSDANPIYRVFARQTHLAHRPINLSAGIRVRDNVFHIQNVNAYDSRLKGWMARFRGVATKYLPNYLGWRRCLERFNENLSPRLLLTQAVGR